MMDADEYNALLLELGSIEPKHVTAMARIAQRSLCLLEDGKVGKLTRAALMAPDASAIGEPADQRNEPWGPFDGLLERIPRTKRQIYDILGNPGTPERPIESWEEKLVKTKTLPGAHGKLVVVHHLVEPHLREGLRRAQIVSDYEITKIGCWNLRHIRNDSDRMLSLHSWGMAVDLDYARNETKTFVRGTCPVPWSKEWMAVWPEGVDRSFVEAMESVGWVWGGVWGAAEGDFAERASHCSFVDGLHFQLRR